MNHFEVWTVMTDMLIDADHRQAALDPERSFIVQAPAGSGKTGLLTQRILRLLTRVNHPEEVVAITFTRKAAAEMKTRLLEALNTANKPAPQSAFLQTTQTLAQEVLSHDRQRGWGLMDSPNRLRIMTIDALCHSIAGQMPVLAQLGGTARVSDDAVANYGKAARATLQGLDGGQEWSQAAQKLLDHLDNNLDKAETLLAAMLAKRDQWLRYVTHGAWEEIRAGLEATLSKLVGSELQALRQETPTFLEAEGSRLANFAAQILLGNAVDNHPLISWSNRQTAPTDDPGDWLLWQGWAALLLTTDGNWRKKLDVRCGFPAQSHGRTKEEKQRFKNAKDDMMRLLERLADSEVFRQKLHQVRSLPQARFSEEQWDILKALLDLLRVAAGYLLLYFAEEGNVDHSEVSQRARTALGSADNPTDLALKLDYQIRHLLVDEFQDTSWVQFELLEQLTAGWNQGEGNTLFLVGDPMQSIYRFRDAEVGLFLKARDQGVGPLQLTPLYLRVNFRSVPGVVDWVNQTMQVLFPQEERMDLGAVVFEPSVCAQEAWPQPSVHYHPEIDRLAEAETVATIAAEARKKGQSVAILVRARSHLTDILTTLDQRGQSYQAIELHPLAQRPVVRDLLALTSAMLHPEDHIAWLAILRAPWCGLDLDDLQVLATRDRDTTLWDRINHPQTVGALSATGGKILQRVRLVFQESLAHRGHWEPFPGHGTLRRWLESTWRALGGPAVLNHAQELEDAQAFFNLLESLEEAGRPPALTLLRKRVATLYAASDTDGDTGLAIMTIHKAKGLEFDVVILPGLDRPPPSDDKQLLMWMPGPVGDRHSQTANTVPLLAPIGRLDQTHDDPIHAFMRRVDKKKSAYETQRLLYVAVTRAKGSLHLLGQAPKVTNKPASGALLHWLWPVVADHFQVAEASTEQPESTMLPETAPMLRRLHSDWQLPLPAKTIQVGQSAPALPQDAVPFEWAGETVRWVGVVVHRYLKRMAVEGIHLWPEARIERNRAAFAGHLSHLGVAVHELNEAVAQVETALIMTQADAKGQWILAANHQEAQAEWAITGLLNGRRVRVFMDRTFVDDQGIRWIIDYKTSLHVGGGREDFLDNEQERYQGQLKRYGELLREIDTRPIRLGLYFPLLAGWREWALV